MSGAVTASPRRPSAILRAGAHLVLLSATLIACTRPYCRFIVTSRRGGFRLQHVRPDGSTASHILPLPSLRGEPSLAELAQHLNEVGRDPLTGHRGLVPLQSAGPQRPLPEGEPPRRAEAVEYAHCVAELRHGVHEELHVWLPLVLRVWPDGHIDAFMPQPADDDAVWQSF